MMSVSSAPMAENTSAKHQIKRQASGRSVAGSLVISCHCPPLPVISCSLSSLQSYVCTRPEESEDAQCRRTSAWTAWQSASGYCSRWVRGSDCASTPNASSRYVIVYVCRGDDDTIFRAVSKTTGLFMTFARFSSMSSSAPHGSLDTVLPHFCERSLSTAVTAPVFLMEIMYVYLSQFSPCQPHVALPPDAHWF